MQVGQLAWTGIVTSLAVFGYFGLKDRVLGRIFKDNKAKIPLWYQPAVSMVVLVVNNLLWADYQRYQEMTLIKGALKLPEFTWLFIAADFVSSIWLLVIMKIRLKAASSGADEPIVRMVLDIIRLIILLVVFTILASSIWVKEFDRQVNWNFVCFKTQMKIDLAKYYLDNQKPPVSLSDFTDYSVNPFNQSRLTYYAGDSGRGTAGIRVDDESGNQIVVGYQDLIGILAYEDNPDEYYNQFKIINDNLCDGKLKIPGGEKVFKGRGQNGP